MLQIAVVGTGSIGLSHLKAIEQSQNCELCAICDVNEEVLHKLSEEYHVPGFTDYKEIVTKTKAEAVILNLPHFLHCEATEFFLDNGLHVLIEKPMANTVEECDRMIAAAVRNNKKLAVGHVQRYFKGNRKVKEIYESGELGRLCMFTEFRSIDYFVPTRPKWFLDKKKAGGGIVMNYGAHALDKLFYVMGCGSATVESAVGNIKNDATIEGHAQFLAKFSNGVSACISFNGYIGTGYESYYYFTDGAIKVIGTDEVWKNKGTGWEKVECEDIGSGMLLQLEEFIKYVKGEPSDIVTGEYGRSVIAVIEGVYREC